MQFATDVPTTGAAVKAGSVSPYFTTTGYMSLAAGFLLAAGIGSMAGSAAAAAMNRRDSDKGKKAKKDK